MTTTLYDAIEDKPAFERAVEAAIKQSLEDLGPHIRELDWANIQVAMRNRAVG